MPETWGIILAAGESKRIKGGKLLLPFGGSTILGTVITHASRSALNGVLVVLGAFRSKILELEEVKTVRTCFNEHYREGMLSSVICGLRSLPPGTGAAMVIPGDQPGITAASINRLISVYREGGKGILVAVHRGKRGHPLLLDLKYKSRVEALDPALGLRSLLHTCSEDVGEVGMDDPGILRDIDTPEDYRKETKQKS